MDVRKIIKTECFAGRRRTLVEGLPELRLLQGPGDGVVGGADGPVVVLLLRGIQEARPRHAVTERLRDPASAAAYLDATAADDDLGALLKGLRHVVVAQGGVGRLAKRTRLSRTTLYKTLSPSGNPELNTLDAILGVYDLRIGFQPLVREKRGRTRAKTRKKP